MSKSVIFGIALFFATLFGSMSWLWSRFGPSGHQVNEVIHSDMMPAKTLDSASSNCDLIVRGYKQIGKELQFELSSNMGGLAPYDVVIMQKNYNRTFKAVPHRNGTWLTLSDIKLDTGPAEITVKSLGLVGCQTRAEFNYSKAQESEILPASAWIRKGSQDNWLDVRPFVINDKIYLKDIANYNDGRTKVIMIDGVEIKNLSQGIEVKPGYLYSITARWIDAPYNDWWNKLRNRSLRQQNIWIDGNSKSLDSENSSLVKIAIPSWFSPSKTVNVSFDTKFPEFKPIQGKLVMQYRLNANVAPENYFNRGVKYLYGWEKDLPVQNLHWTATPNVFADKNQEWFATQTKQEVESYANIPDFGVYAIDFEFWHQHYTPEVKQRLIWFGEKIRREHPNTYYFDYWGGGAYTNPHINSTNVKPLDFVNDYSNPKPNTTNFDKLPNGQSQQNIYNVTPIDVYPKAMFAMDIEGNTPNNFVLLSAIHSLRINQLIPFQKNNKFIFYGWNRYQPLFSDPIVPTYIQTTNPKGELIVNQLETMPASQALSMSLFSLIMFDGYYLWNDSQPQGKDPNGYTINEDYPAWGKEWYPADGKTDINVFSKPKDKPDTPFYWDYPTEFYSLGNWMAKQVEDVLVGGKNIDIPYETNGVWYTPPKEQVLLSMDRKDPFITAVVNDKKIAILAVDCFQAPTATKTVKVKLPNGKETSIELYGNWPSLYKGTF